MQAYDMSGPFERCWRCPHVTFDGRRRADDKSLIQMRCAAGVQHEAAGGAATGVRRDA